MRKVLRFFLASLIFLVGVLAGVAFDTFVCDVPVAVMYTVGWTASAAFALTCQEKK